jgi:uncharacterized protein YuzE
LKINYDEDLDTLTIVRRDGPVFRTVEVEYGLVDLDPDGEILAVEILGASGIIEQTLDVMEHPNLADALASRARRLLDEVTEQITGATERR